MRPILNGKAQGQIDVIEAKPEGGFYGYERDFVHKRERRTKETYRTYEEARKASLKASSYAPWR